MAAWWLQEVGGRGGGGGCMVLQEVWGRGGEGREQGVAAWWLQEVWGGGEEEGWLYGGYKRYGRGGEGAGGGCMVACLLRNGIFSMFVTVLHICRECKH